MKAPEIELTQALGMLAMQAVGDGIVITDSKGVIQWVNPAFMETTGYSADEVIGKKPSILKSGRHDREFYRGFWNTIVSGRTWRGEFVNRKKDGTLSYHEHTVAPVVGGGGQITHFVGVMHDITARRVAQEELALFRELLDQSNDGIEIIDPETGRFLDINARTCQRSGYSRGEMLCLTVSDIEIEAVDHASWRRAVDEVRRAGSKTIEGRHRRKDGSTFPVEVNVRYVRLARDYLVAVVRDVTERKQTQEALRTAEAEYRSLFENAVEGIYRSTPDGRYLAVNPAMARILGYASPEQLVNGITDLARQVYADPGDRVRFQQHLQEYGDIGRFENEALRRDGTRIWISQKARAVRDAGGRVIRYEGSCEDITERKQAEQTIARERELLRTLIDHLPQSIFVKDTAGRYLLSNTAHTALLGAAHEAELIGKTVFDFFSPEIAQGFHADDETILESGKPVIEREESLREVGESAWYATTKVPWRDAEGRNIGLIGIKHDVSERKRAEEILRLSERRFATIFHKNPAAMSINTVVKGRLIDVNNRYCEFFGYDRSELVGKNIIDLELWAQPGDRAKAVERLLQQGFVRNVEARYRKRSGEERDVLASFELLEVPGESEPIMVSMFIDVTELKLAEDTLRKSEEQYRLLFTGNPHPMWLYDLETLGFLAVNDAAVAHYGFSRAEFLKMTILEIRPAEDVPVLLSILSEFSGIDQFHSGVRHKKKDGSIIAVEITSHALAFAGRRARLVLAHDVTDRERAERALQEAEEKYRSIFENSVEGMFQTTPDGKFLSVNPAMARILGYASPGELIDERTDIGVQGYVDPTRREEFKRMIDRDGTVIDFEYESFRKDGTRVWLRENARAVRNPEGRLMCYEGTVIDVTAQRRLEDQLRQSQKMQAIGNLAGGVAHDFNNILTVIQGQAQLLQISPALSPEAADSAGAILEAAQRASALTRQLLTFGRKQFMQLRQIDLNVVLENLMRMLHRTLGEQIHVDLDQAPDIPLVRADVGMMEQVVVNLAINGRDAMRKGGRLLIQTRVARINASRASLNPEASPGEFVRLSITDTGSGIAPEHLPHIFEPFFTTKDVGQGTGLGLATVYGIVKQHGGWIDVSSELGKGTSVTVFLPACGGYSPAAESHGIKAELRGGTETILIVEDEPSVRHLARSILKRYGYTVLEAPDAPAALILWHAHSTEIRLLLTDMVMPNGVSGWDLASEILAARPDLKVILTSGYSADLFGDVIKWRPGMSFLSKPYSANVLVRAVRSSLDGCDATGSSEAEFRPSV